MSRSPPTILFYIDSPLGGSVPIAELHVHTAALSSLCFARTTAVMASGSHDGTVRIWGPDDSSEVCFRILNEI